MNCKQGDVAVFDTGVIVEVIGSQHPGIWEAKVSQAGFGKENEYQIGDVLVIEDDQLTPLRDKARKGDVITVKLEAE